MLERFARVKDLHNQSKTQMILYVDKWNFRKILNNYSGTHFQLEIDKQITNEHMLLLLVGISEICMTSVWKFKYICIVININPQRGMLKRIN